MKRAWVSIALPPRVYAGVGRRLEVDGYACEVAGLDMVVHRALTPVRAGMKIGSATPVFSKTYWTVTEPKTGLAINGYAWRSGSIEQAIEAAEHMIETNGGVESVETRVAAAAPDSPRAA